MSLQHPNCAVQPIYTWLTRPIFGMHGGVGEEATYRYHPSLCNGRFGSKFPFPTLTRNVRPSRESVIPDGENGHQQPGWSRAWKRTTYANPDNGYSPPEQGVRPRHCNSDECDRRSLPRALGFRSHASYVNKGQSRQAVEIVPPEPKLIQSGMS
jgi:hypothetical protein